MNLILVSPERDRSDEIAVLEELFSAGLERYHVRKPYSTADDLAQWIERIPPVWRPRLILHQHHELVERFELGGRHFKDHGSADVVDSGGLPARMAVARPFLSRSCHDLARLCSALGRYDSVLFGPVFSSISKPGYGPQGDGLRESVGAVLHSRTDEQRRTCVFAVGGITTDNAGRALDFGFDGVALLGAVWNATDPVRAFKDFKRLVGDGEKFRRARTALSA